MLNLFQMKLLVIVMLVLCVPGFALSQGQSAKLNPVDWKATPLDKITSPEMLAYRLTASPLTELEKVKVIFNWITENIAYNVRTYRNRYGSNYEKEEDDTSSVFISLDERVAKLVLKRRMAVCDGYARLFKTLCSFVGIKSEVIAGYARTSAARQFRSNHKWNAVLIDSAWYLLDVTWASGYLNYSGDEFIRDYNPAYFLTPPKNFIWDHYPEELQWTLLPNSPTLREYSHTPFKNSAFLKFNILSYKPAKGVIEASIGDSIMIELETNDSRKNLRISDSLNIDSAVLSSTGCEDVKPLCKVAGNKVSYIYKVTSDTPEWLQVIYNDELIMRYKLNIKKSDAIRANTDKNLAANKNDEPAILKSIVD